ncbi:hypothetical protein MIND_00972600 [Mycena indigotica]|uniref:Uncharacterized protein n=1 Tax=Mycena indigotica TaxID=2126181 RepID=A0A8H6SEN9_9AGAR|nr:uncharacterized protein MIND_00972600 [Mycena indigotica]KAF7297390.1 hypothetical protein MIND_00972600 [Mycena indigotica]
MSPTTTSFIPVLAISALILISSRFSPRPIAISDFSIQFVLGTVSKLTVWLVKFACGVADDIRHDFVTFSPQEASIAASSLHSETYSDSENYNGGADHESYSNSDESNYLPHPPKKPMPPMMRLADHFRLYPSRPCPAQRPLPLPSSHRRFRFTSPWPAPSCRVLPAHAHGCTFLFSPLTRLLPYRSASDPPAQTSTLQQLMDSVPPPSYEELDLSSRLYRLRASFSVPATLSHVIPVPQVEQQQQQPQALPAFLQPQAAQPPGPPLVLAMPMDVCLEPTIPPPPRTPPYDWGYHGLAFCHASAMNDASLWEAALFESELAKPSVKSWPWNVLDKGQGFRLDNTSGRVVAPPPLPSLGI